MKKENDEIIDLFCFCLGNVEMIVWDGFWEELNFEMMVCSYYWKVVFFCVVVVVFVLLVLVVLLVVFWFFFLKVEIEEVFI